MGTNYRIISKPIQIECRCPHCESDIIFPFDEVDFNSDYWGDGAVVTCPVCDEDIELDEYEYD